MALQAATLAMPMNVLVGILNGFAQDGDDQTLRCVALTSAAGAGRLGLGALAPPHPPDDAIVYSAPKDADAKYRANLAIR